MEENVVEDILERVMISDVFWGKLLRIEADFIAEKADQNWRIHFWAWLWADCSIGKIEQMYYSSNEPKIFA